MEIINLNNMIWLLLIICIVVTLFFFENLMMMIVYGIAAANNKNATENKETMTRQNIISTMLAIISGILWSCFMYYWH